MLQYGKQSITQVHLLYALLKRRDGLVYNLLLQCSASPDEILNRCQSKIESYPKISGGNDRIYASNELEKVLNDAEAQAEKMKDEYVSVEHLMLGIIDKAEQAIKDILGNEVNKEKLLSALKNVRGNTSVKTDDPEQTYDVLTKYGTDLVTRKYEMSSEFFRVRPRIIRA